ncbi:MAG: hypothetical protein KKA10_16225 [Euryarchaeota archaeon]|nr:hypothetical protein [Euryarchaeota archaeon]MCG2735639.1 hypothetical protein [Candidatus Methanoperedenaceae archaeon]
MQKINKSKRVTIQIPEGTEIFNFLFENGNLRSSKWEVLNQVIKQLPKSKEDRAISVFGKFVEKMSEIFPEKKAQLELLRPLIMKKIIAGGKLEDWYYEELKKL